MKKEKLGVLLIQDMVLFPNSEIRIESDNVNDKQIISFAEKSKNKSILVVNPLIEEENDITTLPNIGVLAEIKLKMDVPNGKTRIVLKGKTRVEVESYLEEDKIYKAVVKEILLNIYDEEETYRNILIKSLEKYISLVPYMSNAIVNKISVTNNLNDLCDLIGSFLPVSYHKKKKYITELNQLTRAKMLIEDMNDDLKVIELEQQLEQEVEKELSDSQKEFYLREKIKVIQKELGDVNSKDDEVELFRNKLSKLKCSGKIKDKIKKEINRYQSTNSNSPELGMIRDYLDWMLNLPWSKTTKDISSLEEVKHTLDSSHYA